VQAEAQWARAGCRKSHALHRSPEAAEPPGSIGRTHTPGPRLHVQRVRLNGRPPRRNRARGAAAAAGRAASWLAAYAAAVAGRVPVAHAARVAAAGPRGAGAAAAAAAATAAAAAAHERAQPRGRRLLHGRRHRRVQLGHLGAAAASSASGPLAPGSLTTKQRQPPAIRPKLTLRTLDLCFSDGGPYHKSAQLDTEIRVVPLLQEHILFTRECKLNCSRARS